MVTRTSHPARRLRVERVTSRGELTRIRPAWDALWASSPNRTPFQCSAWLFSWWEAFGRGDLRVSLLWDDERLVGIAPMYRSDDEPGGPAVRLLGAGTSDYLDLIAAPDLDVSVAGAFVRALQEDGDWSFCAFDDLPPWSPLLHVKAPQGVHETRAAQPPCPVLTLPDRAEALAVGMAARLRRDIRACRRRADARGGALVEMATPETVQVMLAWLFALHEARWKIRGGHGVLAADDVRQFHRLAAPALLSAGILRMYALRIGGRIAAVHYGLQAAGRAYYYIGGFDPAFAALSAGKLVVAAAIERAVEEGASTFDFLSGREAYKYEWGAVDSPRVSRQFRRASSARAGRQA